MNTARSYTQCHYSTNTPDGHRSLKRVYFKSATNTGGGGAAVVTGPTSISHIEETYYVRDASGNLMSTYTQKNAEYTWESSVIYGSSRVGVVETNKLLVDNSGYPTVSSLSAGETVFFRGKKRYEMSNHLGNVLAVVSDKRTLVCINGTQHYEAEIIVAQDYYPGGSLMPERSWSATEYRYGGAGGQEMDNEISGKGNSYTAEYWQYDSRLLRRWNTDPIVKPFESPYACFRNNPILLIGPTGEDVDLGKLSEEDRAHIENTVNSEHEDYNEAYASLYQKLVDDKNTMYTFNNTEAKINYEGGVMGELGYGEKNDLGQDIININYTDDILCFFHEDNALFEETVHADQFRRGELGFTKNNNGTWGTIGLDIYDEVEAKVWAHTNVNNGKSQKYGNQKSELKLYKKSKKEYAKYLQTKSTNYATMHKKTENIVESLMRQKSPEYSLDQVIDWFDQTTGVLKSNNKAGRLPESYKN